MGADLLIRSHQLPGGGRGATLHHHQKVITVFSASNYAGMCDNSACEWENLNTGPLPFQPAPHLPLQPALQCPSQPAPHDPSLNREAPPAC